MSAADALRDELVHESAATRRLLAAAPETKYAWRPHEKAMSLGELCGHIANIPAGMCQMLGGPGVDVADLPPPDPAPADAAEALARHDAAVEAAAAWLGGLGPAAAETWRFTQGETELMAMPRAAAVRAFLLNHLYHHRGQLSAYLRAAGEAVPPVYGPTADVNPFG